MGAYEARVVERRSRMKPDMPCPYGIPRSREDFRRILACTPESMQTFEIASQVTTRL